jgi:rhodanese-related sulfurtransferase
MDWIITPAELKMVLEKAPGSLVLLDVREPVEFEEDHLEGCKWIPLGDLHSRAIRELDPDSKIVIYCAHGVRSMHALRGLRALGFENLRSLEGGLCAYREEP